MEKFNFKLDKVLDYKKTVEGNKKNEYGKIRQRLNVEENKLKNYYTFKDNLKKEKDQSVNRTNIANLKLYNSYLKDIDQNIAKQEEIVDNTKAQLEVVKNALLEATREKKIFEKLKENKYEEYLYSVKKEEEKIIDTIVSYRGNARQ